jgi:hypothetical protein
MLLLLLLLLSVLFSHFQVRAWLLVGYAQGKKASWWSMGKSQLSL